MPLRVEGARVSLSPAPMNQTRRSLSDIAPKFVAKSGLCNATELEGARGTSFRIQHVLNSSVPEGTSRFPKLDECAHFHYEHVDIGPIQICLADDDDVKPLTQDRESVKHWYLSVTSQAKTWMIRRSYENFRMMDEQLHRCIYDRKFSCLAELPVDPQDDVESVLSDYLSRLSTLADSVINCGPVLNWLEMDNRGHRLLVPDTDTCPINTPAVAAAYAVKKYQAQAPDELSFEIGDMISVIDMPPAEESIWWRGKRGFLVGFFPCECIAVIGVKLPRNVRLNSAPVEPSKSVLRKHGKLIAFFRSFILSRPSRRRLRQSGILKERVFGCDLGEHLQNSGHEIPMVLKCCAEFIEALGIVDGIYRLSGATSNIHKLRLRLVCEGLGYKLLFADIDIDLSIRNAFDEDRVPALYDDDGIQQDIHSVASLLKMYFRELPNPLCTYQLYDSFVTSVQGTQSEDRLLKMRAVVHKLPPPHYRTLEYLMRHLSRVANRSGETGMTPRNVAIVWAPNLLRCREFEVGGVAALQFIGVQAVVTEFLICYVDLIFTDKLPAMPLPAQLGDNRKPRPKSLAISTPTKLLSLEEARNRALLKGDDDYIEVGGGPANLPPRYHTVIDLPRKRSNSKRSPLGWRALFGSKGRKTDHRRKNSTPVETMLTWEKVVTESDVQPGKRRLRPAKSVESLAGAVEVPGVVSPPVQKSPSLLRPPDNKSNNHNRSVSHESYFDTLQDDEEEQDVFESPLDISEIQVNFDLEESEMRIFSEDETLIGSGSISFNSPRPNKLYKSLPMSKRELHAKLARGDDSLSSSQSADPSPKKQKTQEAEPPGRSRLEERLSTSAGELQFIDSVSPDQIWIQAEIHPMPSPSPVSSLSMMTSSSPILPHIPHLNIRNASPQDISYTNISDNETISLQSSTLTTPDTPLCSAYAPLIESPEPKCEHKPPKCEQRKPRPYHRYENIAALVKPATVLETSFDNVEPKTDRFELGMESVESINRRSVGKEQGLPTEVMESKANRTVETLYRHSGGSFQATSEDRVESKSGRLEPVGSPTSCRDSVASADDQTMSTDLMGSKSDRFEIRGIEPVGASTNHRDSNGKYQAISTDRMESKPDRLESAMERGITPTSYRDSAASTEDQAMSTDLIGSKTDRFELGMEPDRTMSYRDSVGIYQAMSTDRAEFVVNTPMEPGVAPTGYRDSVGCFQATSEDRVESKSGRLESVGTPTSYRDSVVCLEDQAISTELMRSKSDQFESEMGPVETPTNNRDSVGSVKYQAISTESSCDSLIDLRRSDEQKLLIASSEKLSSMSIAEESQTPTNDLPTNDDVIAGRGLQTDVDDVIPNRVSQSDFDDVIPGRVSQTDVSDVIPDREFQRDVDDVIPGRGFQTHLDDVTPGRGFQTDLDDIIPGRGFQTGYDVSKLHEDTVIGDYHCPVEANVNAMVCQDLTDVEDNRDDLVVAERSFVVEDIKAGDVIEENASLYIQRFGSKSGAAGMLVAEFGDHSHTDVDDVIVGRESQTDVDDVIAGRGSQTDVDDVILGRGFQTDFYDVSKLHNDAVIDLNITEDAISDESRTADSALLTTDVNAEVVKVKTPFEIKEDVVSSEENLSGVASMFLMDCACANANDVGEETDREGALSHMSVEDSHEEAERLVEDVLMQDSCVQNESRSEISMNIQDSRPLMSIENVQDTRVVLKDSALSSSGCDESKSEFKGSLKTAQDTSPLKSMENIQSKCVQEEIKESPIVTHQGIKKPPRKLAGDKSPSSTGLPKLPLEITALDKSPRSSRNFEHRLSNEVVSPQKRPSDLCSLETFLSDTRVSRSPLKRRSNPERQQEVLKVTTKMSDRSPQSPQKIVTKDAARQSTEWATESPLRSNSSGNVQQLLNKFEGCERPRTLERLSTRRSRETLDLDLNDPERRERIERYKDKRRTYFREKYRDVETPRRLPPFEKPPRKHPPPPCPDPVSPGNRRSSDIQPTTGGRRKSFDTPTVSSLCRNSVTRLSSERRHNVKEQRSPEKLRSLDFVPSEIKELPRTPERKVTSPQKKPSTPETPPYCIKDMAAMFERRDDTSPKVATHKQYLSSV